MPTLLTPKDRTIYVCALFYLLLFLAAPAARAQDTQTKTKPVPVKPTSAGSGEQMFNEYCASCHGKDAKGDGPAAPALKGHPSDLTELARHNGGKYPEAYVETVIRFGAPANAAHGSEEMPVWGPIFGSMSGSSRSPEVQLRITNLARYLGTLQVK
jgi:mono/diheme cytochrome c family protein